MERDKSTPTSSRPLSLLRADQDPDHVPRNEKRKTKNEKRETRSAVLPRWPVRVCSLRSTKIRERTRRVATVLCKFMRVRVSASRQTVQRDDDEPLGYWVIGYTNVPARFPTVNPARQLRKCDYSLHEHICITVLTVRIHILGAFRVQRALSRFKPSGK